MSAQRLASVTKNGVGAYVLQCRKMVFNYCENWGSNKGMINYLKKDIVEFAKANPQIEVVVEQRPAHHPVIRGEYLNGREKVICVRNMAPFEIKQKVQLLKESSGAKLKNLTKRPVLSTTESVRGIWSPFHTNPHKI
ncbi:hypothetical protein INT44_000653 [Umbelopsis vinacea]|uniref:Large ribosomal subunit protein mL43 n=1 Tax=Umbelopsis vinacea TaxID=44442 RepID=A0A8H7Q9Z3_9FUNG|nr:hypothetical protein INT44_000653 [Umbelopsis vinacea]KAI9289741.1 thioredoxin-like protein [Umbelopsis sp. AD052]